MIVRWDGDVCVVEFQFCFRENTIRSWRYSDSQAEYFDGTGSAYQQDMLNVVHEHSWFGGYHGDMFNLFGAALRTSVGDERVFLRFQVVPDVEQVFNHGIRAVDSRKQT